MPQNSMWQNYATSGHTDCSGITDYIVKQQHQLKSGPPRHSGRTRRGGCGDQEEQEQEETLVSNSKAKFMVYLHIQRSYLIHVQRPYLIHIQRSYLIHIQRSYLIHIQRSYLIHKQEILPNTRTRDST